MAEKTKLENLEEAMFELLDTVQSQATKLGELEKKIEMLEKTGGKAPSKGKFGGKRERTAVLDTQTDSVYPSKASCGRALCAEVGEEPTNNFAYYKLVAKFPDRFLDLAEDDARAQDAWKKADKELEDQVAAANAALEKEQAESADSDEKTDPGKDEKTDPGKAEKSKDKKK